MMSTLQDWIGSWRELKQWLLHKVPGGTPSGATEGAVWYDSVDKRPYYHDGVERRAFGVTAHNNLSGKDGGDGVYFGHTTATQQTALNNTDGPNGYALLDANGLLPIARIPASLLGAVRYQGTWNASTNTPTLALTPDVSTKGYYYVVNVGGTWNGETYSVKDWIISNGSAWSRVDNVDAVTSVFGRTGAVTAQTDDYTGTQIKSTLADDAASSTLPTAGTATTITTLLQQIRDYLKYLLAGFTNGSVTKVGTATVGSTSQPVYLNAGTPTAISATVGAGNKGVYLNAGTITAMGSTVGSATQPTYLNAGTVTAITGSIANSTTGNAATATKLATARNIAVSGAVTGTASFDGTGDATIATTLADISGTYVTVGGAQIITGAKSIQGAQTEFISATNGNTIFIRAVQAAADSPAGGINIEGKTTAASIATGMGVRIRFNALNASNASVSLGRYGAVYNGSATANFHQWLNGSDVESMRLDNAGMVTVPATGGFAKSGGTAAQFWKANGSVDSSTYLTTSGTAAAATKLSSTRLIELSGDVTGSVGFDGSANVVMTTSAALTPNSAKATKYGSYDLRSSTGNLGNYQGIAVEGGGTSGHRLVLMSDPNGACGIYDQTAGAWMVLFTADKADALLTSRNILRTNNSTALDASLETGRLIVRKYGGNGLGIEMAATEADDACYLVALNRTTSAWKEMSVRGSIATAYHFAHGAPYIPPYSNSTNAIATTNWAHPKKAGGTYLSGTSYTPDPANHWWWVQGNSATTFYVDQVTEGVEYRVFTSDSPTIYLSRRVGAPGLTFYSAGEASYTGIRKEFEGYKVHDFSFIRNGLNIFVRGY